MAFNPGPADLNMSCLNSVDPDQLASDLDLHSLLLSIWIYINNRHQVIWLADN